VFVLGRGVFELGIQLSLTSDREERIADAGALLGLCARLASPRPALTSSPRPQ
jgi:hypothetical protein